jgi:hypothetical protein
MLALPGSKQEFLELIHCATAESERPVTVVIDVDDTAIMPGDGFKLNPNPVADVLEIFKELKLKGWRVTFMTARVEFAREQTEEQLLNAGFLGYDELILMPFEESEEIARQERAGVDVKELNGQWKESQRVRLSQVYDVFAVIDDAVENLRGPTTGHKVWVQW